jgi:hypothetical protein
MTEAERYYTDLVRPLFSGRRLILIGGPVVGLAGLGRQLRNLGAERPFLLGSIVGTGPIPSPDEAEWRSLDLQATNVIEEMRSYEAHLANPPEEILQALDCYDPDRSALVVGLIVLSDIREIAGRRRYAGSLPAWTALDDKVVIDAFWDSAGILRAPSEIANANGAELRAAAGRLDRGMGTVWAGDAREGANGGAVYLRWVQPEGDSAEAERFFGSHCDRVRVMPFLEGIPCSIHGVVFPDGVAAFRPIEMITLRGESQLLYAGTASFWDPAPRDREEMRSIARRTGEALRTHVGYRGPFTVDGVMTETGFLPTELNARFGAGLRTMRQGSDFPLIAILLAAQAGERLDFRSEMLEAAVVEAADQRRGGGGWMAVPKRRDETETQAIVEADRGYRATREGEQPDAFLSVGPGPIGGFLMFGPDPARTPIGPSLAPRAVQAFRLADELYGTGIGPVEAARPVR